MGFPGLMESFLHTSSSITLSVLEAIIWFVDFLMTDLMSLKSTASTAPE